MEANRHRIRFANYIPQVASVLIEHGLDIGWPFQGNPAKGICKPKVPAEKRQEHLPWLDWAVEKWRADAHSLPRLIFEIGVGTVQRPSDWLSFTWGDFDGDKLALRQSKTDYPLRLPCTDALKAALATEKAVLPVTPLPSRRILLKANGDPMNYHYLARIVREERARPGLMVYDLDALRYRGVMELAWANCDDDQIAAYSGHASKDMIRKYAGETRQIIHARQAREKRQ